MDIKKLEPKQPAFTCSKPAMGIPEQCMKPAQS